MMQPRESNIHDLHDSSGRDQESNGHDLFDRISDLPDSILGIILSFLPTKKAVATSILSKRWELVWRTIQNFQFCFSHYNIKVGDEEMKFIRFVDRVLLLHDAGMLNQFHLDWYHNSIPSRAISWIKTAIRRNVRDIFLSVQTSGGWRGVDAGPLEMPTSVFNCDSLQTLVLFGNISVSGTAALNCATISLSTKFTRLMKLETRTYCCDCCPLPDLLQSSDNLEVLIIYQDSRYINRHDCSNWTDPAQVPRCLSNNLKKVVIDGYYVVSANDVNMIRYLLKYGSALETMKISCSISMPKRTKLMLHQEISDFPNKSKVDI